MPVTNDRYTLHLRCDAPACARQVIRATRQHEDKRSDEDAARRVAEAATSAWHHGWRWKPGGEAWCPVHARGRA